VLSYLYPRSLANPSRPRYPRTLATVNEPLIQWLMAPDAPDETLTLEDFLRRPDWHQRAACRGVGPSDYVRGARGNYDAVRAQCEGCPVRQECLEAALADDSLVGLWSRGVMGPQPNGEAFFGGLRAATTWTRQRGCGSSVTSPAPAARTGQVLVCPGE
jgi:hypothetical protein